MPDRHTFPRGMIPGPGGSNRVNRAHGSAVFSIFIFFQITCYIVIKHAVAPITWLASSAQNTP